MHAAASETSGRCLVSLSPHSPPGARCSTLAPSTARALAAAAAAAATTARRHHLAARCFSTAKTASSTMSAASGSPSWHSCGSSARNGSGSPSSPGPSPGPTTTPTASGSGGGDASPLDGPAASSTDLLDSPQPPSEAASPSPLAAADVHPAALGDAYTPWLRSTVRRPQRRGGSSSNGGTGNTTGRRQRAGSWLASPLAAVPAALWRLSFELTPSRAAAASPAVPALAAAAEPAEEGAAPLPSAYSVGSSSHRQASPAVYSVVSLASTEELVEVEEEEESDEEELRIIGPTPGGMQRRGAVARGGRRRRAQVVLSDDDDDDDDDGAYRRAGPEVSPACWSSDGREQTEEAEEEDEEDSDARSTSTSGTGTTAADTDSTFDAPSSGSEDVGASTGSSSSSSAATTASEEDDDDLGEPDGTPAATGGKKKNKKEASSPAAAAAHEDGPGGLAFARRRERLARELYAEWNALVFDGRLPTDLPIVWNPRLRCTAGQVVDDRSRDALKIGATPAARRAERVACRLELSPRVLDRESRLRDTLAHEMAHVAAWTIDRDYERAHGPTFQRWARLFERALQGGVTITTRHGYGPSVPQRRWVCSSEACGCVYSRSKLSIDVRRHVCGLCRGKLLYQGRFTADGQLLEAGPAAPASAAAAAASAAKPKRPLNAFGQFVQAEYAATKKSMGGGGAKHAAVMAVLSARWKESKAKAAEAEAEAAEATHLEEEEEEEEQSLALVGVQLEELRVW